MKTFLFVICCLFAVGATAQNEKKRIAILTTPDTTIDKNIVGLFIDELGVGLTQSGRYEVVGNYREYAAVSGEVKEAQEGGLIDDAQQVEWGKAAGAEYMCFTTIRKIGSNYNIACKISEAQTAKLISSFSIPTKHGIDDLIEVAQLVARRIASGRDITTVAGPKHVKAIGCYYDEYQQKYVDCDISIVDEGPMTYSEALEYCKNKGEGWRLPTKEEMLIIYSKRSKLLEQDGMVPFVPKDYWTSSKRNNYESYVINMGTGSETSYSKNIKNVFRSIRYF
jgi:hypothetical protein